MRPSHVFLALSIVGAILPFALLIPTLFSESWDMDAIRDSLFFNGITVSVLFAMVIATIVLLVFIVIEGRRMGMDRLWTPVVGALLLGVAFGLPFFLYMREMYLEGEDIDVEDSEVEDDGEKDVEDEVPPGSRRVRLGAKTAPVIDHSP